MSEQTTNTQLTIVSRENVQLIAQSAPEIYSSNNHSCQMCNDFGRRLLEQINAQGMDENLDQQCATYIVKARKTVAKMNNARSAVTKLFDQIRSGFTAMENAIDPTKAGTAPYLIQQERNRYAAAKRAEEERRRREEMLRIQRENDHRRYRQEVHDDYCATFNRYLEQTISRLTALNTGITLQNYTERCQAVSAFPVTLPEGWEEQTASNVRIPATLTDIAPRLTAERSAILAGLMSRFTEQYQFEVASYRDQILDELPSKKDGLERAAKADEEEKQRIAAQLKAREQEEAARILAERQRKEQEEAERKKQQEEAARMGNLFSQQAAATPSGYQPKTTVRKRIVFRAPEGIIEAVSLWWSKEGQYQTVEELAKTFRKQITYCERLANDKSNPVYIQSTAITYEDEVKAK